jgi:hypothetical protein
MVTVLSIGGQGEKLFQSVKDPKLYLVYMQIVMT